jgi:hypothetical protein
VPDQAEIDLGKLSSLRVLRLEDTDRAKRLRMRWRYYEQRQHDEADVDFDARARPRGISYTQQRARGYVDQRTATAKNAPLGDRRPSCPTTIAGEIVDTYTAALLGAGRHPTINVVGDPDSTALLRQMFAAANVWDAMAEVRTWAGAQGCAGILPELDDGKLSVRGLRGEDVYVEWTDSPNWIPRIVIEQKLVERENIDPETGAITCARMWQTRAWDEAFAYVYKDVPEDHGKPKSDEWDDRDGRIELAEPPTRHNAGRCPVIWLQNTRKTDDPVGDTDISEGCYEQIDRLDLLWSMILRGTNANNDPTLVIKDKLIERRMWTMRAKGFGQKIELSEVGDATLLEMSGKTIETSWLTAAQLLEAIQSRCGVVQVKPDQAGAMQSGVALQILRATQNNRVAMRRPPVGRALVQLGGVFLTLARAEKIKVIGAEGRGIELAPIAVHDDDDDEPRFELPRLGDGKAIEAVWGELHSPTPSDLQVLSQAATVATGGQPVVSQRTGVQLFAALGQTGVDAETEVERLEHEREERVASFEGSMTPEADGELEDVMAEAEKPDEAAGQEGGPAIQPGEKIQEQALNGAQTKSFVETLSAAGVLLAPEAALFVIKSSFPGVDEAEARKAIDVQVAFAEQRAASQPAPAKPIPNASPAPEPA